LRLLVLPSKSKRLLEAENAVLRQQLIILQRKGALISPNWRD